MAISGDDVESGSSSTKGDSDRKVDPETYQDKPQKAEPYSIYTKREKWFLVALGSFACLLSPLTSNIYLPVLPLLSLEFHKSVELINLTVTSYMVLQGIAPVFWAPIADRYGRRIVFILCLATLSLSCVGLALTPTSAYWLLLLLRCFQAAGSASTVAVSAGLILDIAEPSERGSFIGIYSLGPMAGPAFGPVIGGALGGSLGWRSIFWFMCILAGCILILIVLALPETLRSLVGNGSIRPPRLLRTPIRLGAKVNYEKPHNPPKRLWSNPFRLLFNADVLLVIVPNAITTAVYSSVVTTISILFQDTYPFLTQTDLGLCYLAVGGGCAIGAWVNGRLLDRAYRAAEREYEATKAQTVSDGEEHPTKSPLERKLDPEFPLERARLKMIPANLAVFIACTIGYGWCVEAAVHISAPLILSFFIGWSLISTSNTIQTFILDLFPREGSSITAANNMVRWTLSAVLVACEELIIDALNPGWTFTIYGAICVLAYPMLYYEMICGHQFRGRRKAAAAADLPGAVNPK
ncbi:MFS general substrate transporter [Sistotremastrum suecicum HHB10207 ss-3]|uniref:MFS general substrate transporter n=1 Tax=Sistotremastrum suecicum HHB10207 ss-3 TaxID=1314776 RepID=A0A165YAE4_9AGAM|nr:MFS general substrate transporter [Sistotremastrum suecicum HHB10207 ss-3]